MNPNKLYQFLVDIGHSGMEYRQRYSNQMFFVKVYYGTQSVSRCFPSINLSDVLVKLPELVAKEFPDSKFAKEYVDGKYN